ncbi:hypothetical protein MAR_021929 [Mya arenaria]|uniref:Uncharacterized protein n=1 Tax=Mya arenaria TaxID=6604 RepID=A0ABY7E957_MYAAR|nr:hypothetical protein MAR_021929 [Mya arenaria]
MYHSPVRGNTMRHGAADPGYNAAQTYETLSMTKETEFYDELRDTTAYSDIIPTSQVHTVI